MAFDDCSPLSIKNNMHTKAFLIELNLNKVHFLSCLFVVALSHQDKKSQNKFLIYVLQTPLIEVLILYIIAYMEKYNNDPWLLLNSLHGYLCIEVTMQ